MVIISRAFGIVSATCAFAFAVACSSGGGGTYFIGGDGGVPGSGNRDGSSSASSNDDGVDDSTSTDASVVVQVSAATTSDVLVVHPSGGHTSAGFPKSGNVFVVATVRVKNVSEENDLPTGAPHYSLRSSDGIVYPAWVESGLIDDNCVGHGEVSQGSTSSSCKVVFEIPADAKPSTVEYAASTAKTGRGSGKIPKASQGATGFCDSVNHSTGNVSSACGECIAVHCPVVAFPFEPNITSSVNLPDGTCDSAPYCSCEAEAYGARNLLAQYQSFEGCVDTSCASECVNP